MKKTVLLLSIFGCAILLQGCFYIKQGSYLLKYNASARSVKKIIADPATSQELKDFFNTVDEIRNFAKDSIGLVVNKNYTRFVKIDNDHIADFVSAAEKLDFKQYKWCFPIVGCIEYKGYFKRRDADREAARLSKAGYDVTVEQADAFSTLGFFPDPLYSYMVKYPLYSLASLILHEQTHATIYLKSQAQFNEELASFIGYEGALSFVKMKFGEQSQQYRDVILRKTERETFLSLINNLVTELKSIYILKISDEEKLIKKEEKIQEFKNFVRDQYDSLFETQRYKGVEKMPINNASLAIWMTYTKDLQIYYNLYEKCGFSLKKTMELLKNVKTGKDNPKVQIQKMLNQ
ncbi:MAG: aminopeptidase [Fibrobacter sp.]|nr:aminopeptidase [Fibrobacter sp.]